MGRLVDADAVSEEIKKLKVIFGPDKAGKFFKWIKVKEVLRTIRDIQTVEAIPKGQYEARLKADLEAILTDLYMKIEELDTPSDDSYDACVVDCEKLVQQKINALKGEV